MAPEVCFCLASVFWLTVVRVPRVASYETNWHTNQAYCSQGSEQTGWTEITPESTQPIKPNNFLRPFRAKENFAAILKLLLKTRARLNLKVKHIHEYCGLQYIQVDILQYRIVPSVSLLVEGLLLVDLACYTWETTYLSCVPGEKLI